MRAPSRATYHSNPAVISTNAAGPRQGPVVDGGDSIHRLAAPRPCRTSAVRLTEGVGGGRYAALRLPLLPCRLGGPHPPLLIGAFSGLLPIPIQKPPPPLSLPLSLWMFPQGNHQAELTSDLSSCHWHSAAALTPDQAASNRLDHLQQSLSMFCISVIIGKSHRCSRLTVSDCAMEPNAPGSSASPSPST